MLNQRLKYERLTEKMNNETYDISIKSERWVKQSDFLYR